MRWLLLVGLLLGCAACLQPASITCGEQTCPETWVCTPAGTSCVPRGAADACNGLGQGDSCEAGGLSGICNDAVCEVIICGNGRIDPTEVCDDGNIDANDGCNPTCRSDETCGNGVIDPREGCDCGAGTVQNEACTKPNTDDTDTQCRTDCTLPSCGDGVVAGAEQCEPGLPITATCEQFGFYEGTVGCSSICQLDPATCAKQCGDGVVNGTSAHPESCDGSPPLESCLDYGFDAGRLGCSQVCTPSVASCRAIGWRPFSGDSTGFLTAWGSSPTSVTVTGVVHTQLWNGTAWSEGILPTLPPARYVESTWATPTGTLYGVGSNRVIRWEGTSITEVTIPGNNDLHGIHGVDGNFIVAVGSAGAITYWNGAIWQPMASGTTSRLNGVLVLSTTNAYAVGDGGTVIRYNGTSWAPVAAPPSITYRAIWGTSANDLYVGGRGGLMHFDGITLSSIPLPVSAEVTSIHGSGPNDVWVTYGSTDRTVAHFDGTSWSFSDPGTTSVNDIWSAGTGNTFAAGTTPTRYLGSAWTTQLHTTRPILRAVGGLPGAPMVVGDNAMALRLSGGTWRTVSGDIAVTLNGASRNVVVGDVGTLAVFDGTRLVRKPTDTTQDLLAVWASSDTNAWAVGKNGVIVRYNGTTATTVASGTTQTLNAIFGFSTSDIYAVGDGGTILQWTGSTWITRGSSTSAPLRAFWGTSTTDFWVAGGNSTVRHYAGGVWSDAGSVPNGSYAGIYGSGSDIVVTQANGYPQKFNTGTSTWSPEITRQQLVFIGASSSSEIYGVGYNMSLERRAGSNWREELPSNLVGAVTGTSIYAASPTDIYMTTGLGSFPEPMLHFDGYVWSRTTTSVSSSFASVVGGVGSTAVFAFHATTGQVAYWNGATWQTTEPATNGEEILDFAGVSSTDVWAVGTAGTIRRWNGSIWSTTTFAASPPTANLNAVYVAPDGIAFAVGRNGTALRWTGTSWVATTTTTTQTLEGVWGRSSTDVYAVGAAGTILHWDGASWMTMPAGIGSTLTGVTGATSGATEVFAFGNGGTLVRYDGEVWTPVRSPTSNALVDGAYVGGGLYMSTSSTGTPIVHLERDVTW